MDDYKRIEYIFNVLNPREMRARFEIQRMLLRLADYPLRAEYRSSLMDDLHELSRFGYTVIANDDVPGLFRVVTVYYENIVIARFNPTRGLAWLYMPLDGVYILAGINGFHMLPRKTLKCHKNAEN